MALLLHLNGPPGIGKSTLAALWAERHPGTLDLDIDSLHPLVGGWRNPDTRTHDLLRPVALAMAAAHLDGGHDVVLPQHLGQVADVEAFERVARERGATFLEVVLLDDRAAAIDRFEQRTDATEWGTHNRGVVESLGGVAFLGVLHDQVVEVVRLRPSAVVVRSEPGAVEATYAAVERAVKESGA